MKKIIIFCAGILSLVACTNVSKPELPAAPATPAGVKNSIGGKSYTVETIGLLSPFHGDSSINWNILKEDTTAFFKKWAAEQMVFTAAFSKDSSSEFYSPFDKKKTTGTYSVDSDPNLGYDEPRPGIKLRLKYLGSMGFSDDNTKSVMTLSFLVRGVNEKELVLETGQSFNERPLVVWMKSN